MLGVMVLWLNFLFFLTICHFSTYNKIMINDKWKIKLSTKLSKSITELPENVRSKFLALFKALEEKGAIQYD
jgi:hypothetical protein